MEKTFLDITVLPYRSLSKKDFRSLMFIVSFIFFSVGVFFWYIGAWPVFGFLGLDVLLLYYAFKINYKSGEIFEIVKICVRCDVFVNFTKFVNKKRKEIRKIIFYFFFGK